MSEVRAREYEEREREREKERDVNWFERLIATLC
jgi:hypothetical protein